LKTPKELVREYETHEGGKTREIGPIVYGYSVTIGPDSKLKVRELGNIRHSRRAGMFGEDSNNNNAPAAEELQITAEREPIVYVIPTDKEVKVVAEVPGISKEDIKVNAYNNSVEIFTADTSERKYRRIIDLPGETDTSSITKATYKNGMLEITFTKKCYIYYILDRKLTRLDTSRVIVR
jgi:HSP20 family protein